MYAVNRLSSHDYAPSAPIFQGINNLIRYLAGCPNYTIMYATGLDGTTIHDLHQEVYPVEFHSQKIYNGLITFADGV